MGRGLIVMLYILAVFSYIMAAGDTDRVSRPSYLAFTAFIVWLLVRAQ